MEHFLSIVAGGFLLGLAGSVHCACMCGGIASGALFILNPQTPRERLTTLLLLQAGRISTYAIAGGAIAGMASLTVDLASAPLGFRLLQWMGAAALMWIGLSTAGLLPRLAVPGPGSPSLAMIMEPILTSVRERPRLGPLALGLSWGLTPCPMVYAALLSATLAGSSFLGVAWMFAFGAGTLPGVISAAFGVSALSRLRRGPAVEMAAGLAIAAFGLTTLYLSAPSSLLLCAWR